MAQISFPLDKTWYYTAEAPQLWLSTRTNGVFSSNDDLMCTAVGGRQISISPGIAWLSPRRFVGTVYGNTDDILTELELADGALNRIDRIVIRWDYIRNDILIDVKQGAAASSPTPPELQRDTEAFELGLHDIYRGAGTLEVTQADITPLIMDENLCGIMRDGVTGIPTSMLHAQWESWFANIKIENQKAANELRQWISLFRRQAETEWEKWFNSFAEESASKFRLLEEQIHDILDEGAAGALLNMLNAHKGSDVNDEAGIHNIRQRDNFIEIRTDGEWEGARASFPPPDVTGFRAIAGIDTIALNWSDPDDVISEGLTLSSWARTRIVRHTNRFPENENDGTIVVETTTRNLYAETPFIDSGLYMDQEYFYQAFPISDSNIFNRSETNRVSATTASAPPGDVTGFTATAAVAASQITLKWTDPTDDTWAGTKIVRGDGGYPANEFDGILVVDSIVRDQYQTTGFVDSGLTASTTYYYQAFPYSVTGAVNRNEANRTSAKTAEPISTTLANNTWDEIAAVSAAGLASTYWKVGDTKNIVLTTNETLTLQIYDFNHDDLTAGGKAGITFGLKNLMIDTRAMNSTNTNVGSFAGSAMYAWITGTLFNQLPTDLRNLIKAVNKKTSAGNQSTTIKTESMRIFLFSEIECFGLAINSVPGEGYQYPIFTDNASRIKNLSNGSGMAYYWFPRSPNTNLPSYFCSVSATGTDGYTVASNASGVCFGFCI